MKQEELDPTNELDAGWDEVEAPSAALAATGAFEVSPTKPLSLAPASGDTDELDEGWEDEDSEVAAPTLEAPSRPGPAAAPAVGSVADRARTVSLKKARREAARKNQEHARRRKKTRKAERKAERREQARLARELKEQQARAERERQALLAKERARSSVKTPPDRPAPRRRADTPVRPESKPPAPRDARAEKSQRSSRRPKASRQAKPRSKARGRAQQSRPRALWLLAIALFAGAAAWLLWPLVRG